MVVATVFKEKMLASYTQEMRWDSAVPKDAPPAYSEPEEALYELPKTFRA